MAAQLISRKDAREQGLKRFFTGRPCRRGHLMERFVSTGSCIDCEYLRHSKSPWNKEDAQRRLERRRLLYEARALGEKTYSIGEPCRHGHICDRRTSDGKCVQCVALAAAERGKRYHKEHPDRVRATNKRWREAHPDVYDESTKKSKKSYRLKYTAAQKEDYANNPEKYRAAWKRYYERKRVWHIERAAIQGRTRRAQQRGSGGTHTAADLKEILEAQGHRCAYCRADLRKTKKHLDHVIALSRGGSNGKQNLQWLCQSCNLSKGAKDPADFARSIGLLV